MYVQQHKTVFRTRPESTQVVVVVVVVDDIIINYIRKIQKKDTTQFRVN
jgi:hypothetical protein